MNILVKVHSLILVSALLLIHIPKQGIAISLSDEQIRSVIGVSRNIASVQPHLSDSKYIEFGLAVYRASEKYGIDSSLLIAITQQESSFRENLPEGRAGEIGICQIRKTWRGDRRFKKEFGKVRVADMFKSENSLMYAAWILSELRGTKKSHKIPYWTYYNANGYHHRLRYFRKVDAKYSRIKRSVYKQKVVASLRRPKVTPKPIKSSKSFASTVGSRRKDKIDRAKARIARLSSYKTTQKRKSAPKGIKSIAAGLGSPQRKPSVVRINYTPSRTPQAQVETPRTEGSWIQSALSDLKKDNKRKSQQEKPYRTSYIRQASLEDSFFSKAISRAADELGIKLD